MTAFIILPGGWAGGWQSRQVAGLLKYAGRTVFSPTFTYLSQPVRPSHPEEVLNTHVQDVLSLIERENVRDIILVGFDLSGDVVTRVAQLMPERIRHLAYVDARAPENVSQMTDSLRLGLRLPSEMAAPALPHTYLRCTAKSWFAAATAPAAYNARAAGWAYWELPLDDTSRVAMPEELAGKLLELA